MSIANTSGEALLNLLLTNAAMANIGNAGGLQPSATTGNLYIALHDSDPGSSGNQSTGEATYTSYARVAVARSSSGWTVSGLNYQNAAAITFPKPTGGSDTLTYFSIGTAASGTGQILFSAALTPPVSVTASSQAPSFAAGALTGSVA